MKRKVGSVVPIWEEYIPRLNKRGPVEALIAPGHGTGLTIIPRLNKRGPVEALGREEGERGDLAIPRLNKRGPVEASTPAAAAPRSPSFRA